MRKRLNKKGFTLAELLIVVAIIGVLVAISIPIFTSQLEKAREAVDAANIRAAYAEVASAALTQNDSKICSKAITMKQKQKEWQSDIDFTAELKDTEKDIVKTSVPTTVYVTYDAGTDGAAGTFKVVTANTGYTEVD